MIGLFMVGALGIATFVLAHRLGRLEDTLGLVGVCLLGGLALLAVSDLPWVADPREDDQLCAAEELPEAAPAHVPHVSVAEARTLVTDPGVTFVDARPAAAYEYAHIPGALSLPADDAEGLLDLQSLPIPADSQVVTYCEGVTCERSTYLGALLAERGVCRQVRVLEGGWQAWVLVDGATVSGASRFGDAGLSSSVEEADL